MHPLGDDLLVFRHDPARDPDGSKFRALLEAHVALQRVRTARERFTGIFLVVTVASTLSLAARGPTWLQVLARVSWGFTAFGLAAATVAEWRWRRERTERLEALDA